MKKLIVILLAIMCALAVLPVSALSANGSFGDVPLYKGTITIDGKKDAIYDKGLKLNVNQNFSDSYKTTSSAVIYLLHDGSNIYLFVEAKSAHAIADTYNTLYATKDIYKSNCFEVMFDFSNDAKSSADCFKVQTGFFGALYGEFLAAGKEKTLVTDLKTVVDKSAKTVTAEYKIKMQENAKTGSSIGFNFMYDSDPNMGPNNESKQCQIACINPGVSNAAEKYKNITLASKEVQADTTAAATTKAAATTAAKAAATTAAETADASVVIAAVLVSAAAAAVVLKKRK